MSLDSLTGILKSMKPLFVEGISEYALIRQLQSEPHCVFEKDALNNDLTMFQCHFMLFHCLYTLQKQWVSEGAGYLQVLATDIRLFPLVEGESNAVLNSTESQKLQAYYLDLNNLRNTDEADVQVLLKDFWSKMEKHFGHEQDNLNDAFSVLKLPPSASKTEVKKRYRELMHSHHPDKGGTHHQAIEIEQAYRRLMEYL